MRIFSNISSQTRDWRWLGILSLEIKYWNCPVGWVLMKMSTIWSVEGQEQAQGCDAWCVIVNWNDNVSQCAWTAHEKVT